MQRMLAPLAFALALAALCGCGAASSREHDQGIDGPPPPPASSADDAGAANDASQPGEASAPPPVLPFGATPDAWRWVDVPGALCGNGSPTGMGVNLHRGATRMVVVLQGGGACADGATCWTTPTAANIATGFGAADLPAAVSASFLFARADATNPFRDASYVFVPYCTGDLHGGDGIATYDVGGAGRDTFHYGAHNLDAILARLRENLGSLPGLERAYLVGESAGGFGAVLNQDFVARALSVRVDVIDDSGPPLRFGGAGYPPSWKVRVPPGCGDCENGLDRVYAFDRRARPSTRFAFMTFTSDTVLPDFFGVTPATLAQSIAAFLGTFASEANAKSFLAIGSGHAVLGSQQGASPSFRQWLSKMTTDDPSWSDAQN